MFTATLLTNPETPILSREAVESLRNAWGGGDALWLDPGVAAEFPLAAVPDNLWQVWESFQSMKVDLAVQPAEGRRKRLLIADMDSTMIQQECIDELADEVGRTSIPGIFASGDAVKGARTVVEAVAYSKTVAEAMHEYMQTLPPDLPDEYANVPVAEYDEGN